MQNLLKVDYKYINKCTFLTLLSGVFIVKLEFTNDPVC